MSRIPVAPEGRNPDLEEFATHLTPPMVDGGTTFAFDFRPAELPTETLRALDPLRSPRSRIRELEDRQAGGRVVSVEFPDGQRTGAVQGVTGERQQRIAIHFVGEAYLKLDLEDGSGTVELKADGLWRAGVQAHAGTWLANTLALISGARLGPAPLADHRFRCTRVDICVDAIGMRFHAHDRGAFVGVSKKNTDIASGDTTETLQFGGRNAAIRMTLYDKVTQVEQVKRCSLDLYGPWWEAGARTAGLNLAELLDENAPVRRLEFRLRNRALQFEDRETGEVLDLRDPLRVVDTDTLAQVWSHLTHKSRLVLPDSATRRERCATDPRWAVFQQAVDADPGDFVQRRDPTPNVYAEARNRARTGLLKHAVRLAALHDHEITGPEGLATVARLALEQEDGSALCEGSALRELGARYRETRDRQLGTEITGRGAQDLLRFIEQHGLDAKGLRRFQSPSSPKDTETSQ